MEPTAAIVLVLVVMGVFLLIAWALTLSATASHQRTEVGELLHKSIARPKSHSRDLQPVPTWMFPAGIIAIAVGVLALAFGAAHGGAEVKPDDPPGKVYLLGLVEGALNPLFFVGVPLGCYWLYRSAKGSSPISRESPSGATMPPSDEGNPKLTHCPDCGGHVSRLATACPHCGRPMTPDSAPTA
jgi:hypothetical protein